MNALSMTRSEFRSLLPPPDEIYKRRRAAEKRRMRVCSKLAALIGEIADASPHPGMSLRELAAILPADEGTFLLELVDRLDHESRVYRQPPQRDVTEQHGAVAR
jgi:hypothetical protein